MITLITIFAKLLKSIYRIVFIITLISYLCVFIPPEKFWPAIIISYGILPLLILNLLLLFLMLLYNRKSFIWPFLGLIFGIFFINISFHYQIGKESQHAEKSISIVSFNADELQGDHKKSDYSNNLFNWIINDSSSIKCIQEYHTNDLKPEVNIREQIALNGFKKHTYRYQHLNNHYHGLAIYSRFPIINQGTLLFNEDSKNNCIFIDVKILGDTIRIYNVHLTSYTFLKPDKKNLLNFGNYLKSLIMKLKKGAVKHTNEINLLMNHTSKCSFPYIICGDFNEIPYSYNYLKLRDYYANSFEKAGSGFGFSYAGRLFFLRIDHHFVSEGIRPIQYRVNRSISNSEHFPTRGLYEIL